MQFSSRSPIESEAASQPSDALPIGLAIAIFSLLSLLAAVLSEGFLNGDACSHYLFARYALSNPIYLVDVWGRPLVTGLYAIPALLAGRLGVRVASLLVAISCSIVAMRLAREQGLRRPVLAMIFTLAQPLLFLHSFSELTELPFALLLGLAFGAFGRQRWLILALLAGLLPLTRPEGFGFLLMAAVALVSNCARFSAPRLAATRSEAIFPNGENRSASRRVETRSLLAHNHLGYLRPIWLVVLVLPLLAWEYAAWRLTGRTGHWWTWLARNWPWGAHSLYGHGSIFSFVAVLPLVVGPIVLPAMLIGVGWCLRDAWHGRAAREFLAGHGRAARATPTCILLTAVIPLLVLAGHTVLYWRGMMASDGEARYLLIAAPFWGILSARGWETVFIAMKWKHSLRWAGIAALAPLVANVVHPVVPVHAGTDWQAAHHFADEYRSDTRTRLRYPRVIASHPGIFYYLDIDPKEVGADRNSEVFTHPPPGTLLVWDPTYSSRNADAARVADLGALRAAGWVDDESLNRIMGAAGWHILRSQEAGPGSPGPGK